jgi:hypothetical protein
MLPCSHSHILLCKKGTVAHFDCLQNLPKPLLISMLLKTPVTSLRGALIASLPQHALSRGGNLEFPDIFNCEIASPSARNDGEGPLAKTA